MVAINGIPVSPDSYSNDRARRLAEREFNLSSGAGLPQGNRITQGRWHGSDSAAQWSVEKGLAAEFGLKLGIE